MTIRHQRHAAARACFTAFAAALVGLAQGTSEAFACYVHSGQYQGFQVSHALSVPVSVSTRQAIVDGNLRDIPRATASERRLALKQLAAVVGFFGKLSESGQTPAAPDFAVLLTESGLWTGFSTEPNDQWRVRQHLSGPKDTDVVIALSDPTMAALLQGRMTVERAVAQGLLETAEVSAASQRRSLVAFDRFIDRFARSNYAGFQLIPKLPDFRSANPLSSVIDARPR
jgi:hypothetical protein